MDDAALLAAFVEQRSEEAFNELVRRHVAMVYAACRRQLRDAHAAEDVTQAVFILLAQKAATLPKEVVLGGWLYRTALYACSNARNLQKTRAYHENRVNTMKTPDDDESLLRAEMEGLLDEGLMQLSPAQREVIVLRFFEDKTLTEVAEARRQSLYATQKSLNAGMANLRRFLAQRGMTVPLAAVGVLLAAQSAKAVPLGLAATVGAAALQGGAAVSVPAAQLVARLGHQAGRAKLLASLAVAAVFAVVGISLHPWTTGPSSNDRPFASLAAAHMQTTPTTPLADIEALQRTLRRAELALRHMDIAALGEVVAFHDPAQSTRWQLMTPVFAADLALRQAAAARFGLQAARLTAMKTFADRLDEVLPTVDNRSAAWTIHDDDAVLHFSYRDRPEVASLFFTKNAGQWQIDATRSVDLVLEGIDADNARAPIESLNPEQQARVVSTMQSLQQALSDVAERINGGQVTDIDEARQELQLADAHTEGRAFFKLALRTQDDRTAHD